MRTLVLIGLASLHVGVVAQTASPLLAPNEVVAGRTQAEWSRVWWQWAGSFDQAESPVADRTGELCHARQEGPVWFLAGTYGTRRTVRTCVVPAGKHLFFPLINYVVFPSSEGTPSCRSVTSTAARATNDVSNLVIELDGVVIRDLTSHRQATVGCFDLLARHPGGGELAPAAANGYYVMLKPLSRGVHKLNFGGALPDMLQAVTYTLHVQ